LAAANHFSQAVSDSAAGTYSRLYYFERAAGAYIRALQAGRPLRVLSDEIAEKLAVEMAGYPDKANRLFGEFKEAVGEESSTYANELKGGICNPPLGGAPFRIAAPKCAVGVHGL